MYGLYGLKHHTVEMLPCRTGRRTREDKATQPLDAGRLSFAIIEDGDDNAVSGRHTPAIPAAEHYSCQPQCTKLNTSNSAKVQRKRSF